MIDVAEAIDDEAEPVTLTVYPVTPGGKYDGKGNAIRAVGVVTTILAAIQPVSGRQLKDVPEGIIKEVSNVGWSRTPVAVNNEIGYGGETFRVTWTWPRPRDGFTKFTLRKIQL